MSSHSKCASAIDRGKVTSGPLVSIIIANYNYGRYLEGAILSCLSQTYSAVEIIAVDDGSTDESRKILSRFKDRINVIEKRNGGHVSALQVGLSASQGEVIIFLDADDALEPPAAQRVVEVWNSSTVKVQFNIEVVDERGNSKGRTYLNYPKRYNADAIEREFRQFGTYWWPVTLGNAYQRKFLLRMFPLPFDNAPDGHLNTLAPLFGRIEVVHQVLGRYRHHGKNQSLHGTTDDQLARRFLKQIELRLREEGELRRMAKCLNHAAENLSPSRNEIEFINYVMMYRTLGGIAPMWDYSQLDTLRMAMQTILRRSMTARSRFKFALWSLALAVLPRSLGERLIILRLSR